jgi:hypothetical protein
MVDKLDEMEEKLNEQIERNVALNRRLAESVADVIFAEVAEGLALSQKDKLASLAENVEFDSEANYREKLVTLRESYFPKMTPKVCLKMQPKKGQLSLYHQLWKHIFKHSLESLKSDL